MTDRDPELSDLIRDARAGDRASFELLVRRHGPDLLQFLSRLTRRREEAQDLFQDTLLAAYRTLGALRDPSAFRSWLATIATNLFRRRARSRPPVTFGQLGLSGPASDHADGGDEPREAGAEDPESASTAIERSERGAILRALVAELPERQRAVLSLRLDLGLPFQQIASTLGITEENARACHYQALKTLRRRLPHFASAFGEDR